MRGDDHLDRRIEPVSDLGDVAAREVAGAAVERGRAGLEAALVDDQDPESSRPGLREPATARFAASASSWNVRPATPVGVTIVGVTLSTSPMNPTLNFRLPLVGA